jgi:hypothetical protein
MKTSCCSQRVVRFVLGLITVVASVQVTAQPRPEYDPATQELRLPQVKVGDSSVYDVKLKHEPPANFKLISYSPTPTGTGLFTFPHPWSTDVSALQKSARSDAIINTLIASGGFGQGRLQTDFALTLLAADSKTPRRTVVTRAGGYCYNGPDCDPVPMQMPFPVGGNVEDSSSYVCSGGDCHILVYERDEKKLYELYSASEIANGNVETRVGIVWDTAKQYGPSLRGEQCTSADAAGLPIAALLPTADEVAAGEVPHALRFILPNVRMKKGVYVHPATHAGGPSSTNADAPPYGVRLRLKASFDESKFNASARVILRAMKKYGMILADGGTIALTFGSDKHSQAKWSGLGITSQTFNNIGVDQFEVVDLGAEIKVTYDCVRVP